MLNVLSKSIYIAIILPEPRDEQSPRNLLYLLQIMNSKQESGRYKSVAWLEFSNIFAGTERGAGGRLMD